MFNPSAGRPRGSDSDPDPSYGFTDPAWPKFGLNTSNSPSMDPSQSSHASGRNFSSLMGMDWAPSPSDIQPRFQHQVDDSSNDVDMDISPHQDGGGVGRLVAHFENKGFAPPLPPRPSNTVASPITSNPPASSPFGSFAVTSHNVASPLSNSSEVDYGSLASPSRVISPVASPPPMSFGGFHPMHPGTNSMAGSSSGQYGNMDSFMMNHRVTSPMTMSSMGTSPMITSPMAGNSMVAPPMTSTPMLASPKVTSPSPNTPGVPGTPGFAIWRPPVPMTPKPVVEQSQFSSNTVSTGGYFTKPPIPSTPKPVMNAGSQLVLDFNQRTKARGKAPARAPSKQPARQPTRQPSKQQFSAPTPPTFSPSLKQEPETPQLSKVPPSVVPLDERRPSVSSGPKTGTRPSRELVPAEAWESFKSTIRVLYLEERKPLKEVISIMIDKYGFEATPKMYKTRFSQWGFVKNNTEDEVKRLLSMKFQRDAEGKVSEFVRNGKVVNLGTYLKRKGVTEYDLIDFEQPADLPAHIRCRTPTPPPATGYLQSPDLLRAQETVVGNMRKAFLQCRQFEVETDTQVGWSTMVVWGAGSSDLLLEANHYFEMRDADQGGHYLMMAFKQLEVDLKKLSPQGIKELLLGMVHRDPGMMTALCKYLAAYSTTNFERSHPLRQIFTCLYEVQQKHGPGTLSDLLWSSIPTIAEELEAIYGRRHPYVARTWIDLAIFYNHANPERLDKLIGELRLLQRQMENRHGLQSVDVLVLRHAIVQLMYCASPSSDSTKNAAIDLWNHIRSMGLAFPVRDSRPNVYCYHSPVKVDPWTKRCRRRYDVGVQFMEEHVGVRIMPYFEEDFHTTEHALEPQDSWAAAMEQQMGGPKWSFI
ncbi:hypothetical protein EDB81DRAFT_757947 [Dactylonectria macrodidyma]|uniref:Clr5 domain-containing protein n=1 Tax=Dactylonectria macrodidyma TaxID=307937 RepID=A0A9P9F3F6_9HYPO|nr:hypothetical protein EDB81DRAFT_757947 [Dactylonectria macrodidyma]